MIEHNGKSVPVFPDIWDSSDRETIWVSWADKLDGSSISDSIWSVPTGWNNHSTQEDQTVEDEDGNSYANCNGVETSVDDAEAGDYIFKNTVTFADGRIYQRSVKVILGEL